MLPESRLYTFLDNANDVTLHFFEAQKLIQDLALLHNLKGKGFAYFRQVVLTIEPLISLLKAGEMFGFYIDSDEPSFRLKIEANFEGHTRSILVPEEFDEFPRQVTGFARMVKVVKHEREPYSSIVKLEQTGLDDIVNLVLKDSYQIKSHVVVAEQSDQSIMFTKLPPLKNVAPTPQLDVYIAKQRAALDAIFEKAPTDQQDIVAAISGIGGKFLGVREIKLRCDCSKDRMIAALRPLYFQDPTHLFDEGQRSVDARCDYCKTTFVITREELYSEVGHA